MTLTNAEIAERYRERTSSTARRRLEVERAWVPMRNQLESVFRVALFYEEIHDESTARILRERAEQVYDIISRAAKSDGYVGELLIFRWEESGAKAGLTSVGFPMDDFGKAAEFLEKATPKLAAWIERDKDLLIKHAQLDTSKRTKTSHRVKKSTAQKVVIGQRIIKVCDECGRQL